MSLLQHPLRALEQVEWYLESGDQEIFPGAYLLAAGNLSRQVLEQILFILAFYSQMPRSKFLKSSNELRTAGAILKALHQIDPTTGHRYIELARRRGPRIRKFARFPQSLDRWRRILNESSHFSNPAAGRKTRANDIRDFATRIRSLLEEVDGYLITAAVNEIRTKGFVKAVLDSGPGNVPGVLCTTVVTPKMIDFKDGQFTLRIPAIPITVIPDSRDVPYRWTRRVVLVQHSSGMNFEYQMVTKSGSPVNLSDFNSMLSTFAADPRDRRELIRRMRQLGIDVQVVQEAEKR